MATIFTVHFCICLHFELNDQNLFMPCLIILILIENFFCIFQRSMKETGKITLTIWIFTTTWITPPNPGLWLRTGPSVGETLVWTQHKTKPMVDPSSYYSWNFLLIFMQFQQISTIFFSLKCRLKTPSFSIQSQQRLVELLSLIILGFFLM